MERIQLTDQGRAAQERAHGGQHSLHSGLLREWGPGLHLPLLPLLLDKGFPECESGNISPKVSPLSVSRLGRRDSGRVHSLRAGCEGFIAQYYQAG